MEVVLLLWKVRFKTFYTYDSTSKLMNVSTHTIYIYIYNQNIYYILHVEYSFVEMLSITAHSMCAQQTHGDGIREMNGSLKKEKTMRRENEVRRCVNGFYTSVRWY